MKRNPDKENITSTGSAVGTNLSSSRTRIKIKERVHGIKKGQVNRPSDIGT